MGGKGESREVDKPDPEDIPITAIMQEDFVRVHPETPVADIYRSFTRKGVSISSSVMRHAGFWVSSPAWTFSLQSHRVWVSGAGVNWGVWNACTRVQHAMPGGN